MTPALIETVGYIAATCTTLCWLPQAVRTIRTRDTNAISAITQAVFALGIMLWLIYGIATASWPITIANAVTLPLVLVVLAMKLRFG